LYLKISNNKKPSHPKKISIGGKDFFYFEKENRLIAKFLIIFLARSFPISE